MDCTYEHTNEIIIAVLHGLKRIFGNSPVVVYDQCTDSGGGGTGQALFRALSALGVTCHEYLVASCSLHNIQTGLRNGVELVLGEGGLDDNMKGKRNAMQLLHGVYNLQNWCEHDELKDIYLYTHKEGGKDSFFEIRRTRTYTMVAGQ